MKPSSIVLLVLAVGFTGWNIFRYFWERRRQKIADREGVVVYATFLSSQPVKFFWKVQRDLEKVTLRVQEPHQTETRDVTIKTRTDPTHDMTPGMRIPVVIDPKDPKRIYPASEQAAKRAVPTGSRLERRIMKQQMRTPGRRPPSMPTGYQPPPSKLRRR